MAHPWYENALLITAVGSIIVVIGQLAGTVIPIMYGAEDASDFSINIEPIAYIYHNLDYVNATVRVNAEDLHPFLRPYRFKIFLRVLGVPRGAQILFHDSSEIRAERFTFQEFPETTMFRDLPEMVAGGTKYVDIASNGVSGYYPIIVQGTGADGKIRNATFYLLINTTSLSDPVISGTSFFLRLPDGANVSREIHFNKSTTPISFVSFGNGPKNISIHLKSKLKQALENP